MAQLDPLSEGTFGQTLTQLLGGRSYSTPIMCDSHPKKQKWLSAESGCGCIYDDIQTVMSMPKCVAGLTGLGRPGAGNGQEKGEGCGGDPGDGGGLLDRRLRSQTGVQGTPGGFEWCGMGCGRARLKGEIEWAA